MRALVAADWPSGCDLRGKNRRRRRDLRDRGPELGRLGCRAPAPAGLWTLQAGIFPENPRSLDLHERAGFRVVGRRERLGARNGVWRDVVLLERRGNIVGT